MSTASSRASCAHASRRRPWRGPRTTPWSGSWPRSLASRGAMCGSWPARRAAGSWSSWTASSPRQSLPAGRACGYDSAPTGDWLSRLERPVHIRKVTGSNPVSPTTHLPPDPVLASAALEANGRSAECRRDSQRASRTARVRRQRHRSSHLDMPIPDSSSATKPRSSPGASSFPASGGLCQERFPFPVVSPRAGPRAVAIHAHGECNRGAWGRAPTDWVPPTHVAVDAAACGPPFACNRVTG